ncbi:hypothetical protein FA95DRAFT_1578042 [Auriscalpium vulgare]|uniref:Uncharacterized protein n=1 Tax=Auriscalpium vulgare TaxID=40419 RepID=A0ACB8R531_9AGAM|nr:hypothetical protein FA95DRAFT_1578042 [Auriscalpium vulgare]
MPTATDKAKQKSCVYSSLERSKRQLVYHHCDIFRLPERTWYPPSTWKRMLYDRPHEEIVLNAYRWLTENYRDGDGDHIFLFVEAPHATTFMDYLKVGLVKEESISQIDNQQQSSHGANTWWDNACRNFEKKGHIRQVVEVYFLRTWESDSSSTVKDTPVKYIIRRPRRVCRRQPISTAHAGQACPSITPLKRLQQRRGSPATRFLERIPALRTRDEAQRQLVGHPLIIALGTAGRDVIEAHFGEDEGREFREEALHLGWTGVRGKNGSAERHSGFGCSDCEAAKPGCAPHQEMWIWKFEGKRSANAKLAQAHKLPQDIVIA